MLLVCGLGELLTTGSKCQLCMAAAALFTWFFITEPEDDLDLFPRYTRFRGIRQQRECASVSQTGSESKSCDRGRAVVQTPANWLMARQAPCLRGIHYYPGVMRRRSTKLVGVCAEHCFGDLDWSSGRCRLLAPWQLRLTGSLSLNVERCGFRVQRQSFFCFYFL